MFKYEPLKKVPEGRIPTQIPEFDVAGRKTGSMAEATAFSSLVENTEEREEFLEKFYNIKRPEPIDESKVCKIRYLDIENENN